MKLIDKDALVAEIEKLMNRYDSEYDEDSTEVKAAKGNVCHEILCTIDTLEMKEVDLETELLDWIGDEETCGKGLWKYYEVKRIAKHFFELGMQQSKNYNNNEE